MIMTTIELENKARSIRLKILETAIKAGKGHVPPAFSWADIGVALFYGGILRLRPEEPDWPGRDRFILSKGHGCLTQYVIMADLGFFRSTITNDRFFDFQGAVFCDGFVFVDVIPKNT